MAIRTSASLLQAQWDDPEVRDAFVRFVPNEVDRINQLIENLIGYARPVKGEQQPMRLSDIVTECLYLTAIAAKKHNIICTTQLNDELWIFANRDRIKQSLINIIINGIESIEKKLTLGCDTMPGMSICAEAEGEFALIRIRDEGMGMRKEDIWRCTEPFYTTKSAGTGLGLALVQQFLSKNGGTISIDSEEGVYTEVCLKFRRYRSDEGQYTDH
jgi:polar amino acid transport system substrate-binding protein